MRQTKRFCLIISQNDHSYEPLSCTQSLFMRRSPSPRLCVLLSVGQNKNKSGSRALRITQLARWDCQVDNYLNTEQFHERSTQKLESREESEIIFHLEWLA